MTIADDGNFSKLVHLKTQHRESILIVTLNRPEYNNALNMKLRDELEYVFSTTKSNDQICGIVLNAEGKNFCAGYDLEEVIQTNLDSFRHRILEYHYEIYSYPKPVIALLKGFCSAGGFDLALCGDYIIAEKKTILFRPEIRFNGPPLITSLARKVGPSKALSITLKGDPISVSQALEWGIIDEIDTSENPLEHAIKVATKLSQWNLDLIRAEKDIANNLFHGNLHENLRREFDLFAKFLEDPSFLENLKKYAGNIRQKVS
ncbi:enoyl-CoA hydratase [Leptospira perolatii]|uniref:Enoyl-CoA hydratase n=1 Tax=Leptospira perolatii TaxID=2023191 RepID=A0A2M9ZS11_9LEPT|nr:enoyl-CoA hydratase/isomerase family protein [Leptospira perolatii]PJZ71281.1 enoyl-CoA hydratase [Leptospira perolatii]PJZ74815.1 enoyl-CoA hydratase [Leptospira perolatii]